ncbi:MAG: cytochrome oxidase subunit III [Cytophagales bacterium]|nr:MAG: cytochrome oxidase subunit III [Cytophagales bacterium]TAF60660.1 MAG: cytochrome oxidase subunit III [Cytophagales bacterium]
MKAVESNILTVSSSEAHEKGLSEQAKVFALIVGLGSILMTFAALTSAYIVRRGDGKWIAFDLPSVFYWSTLVIVLSSLSMIAAQVAAKRDELLLMRASLIVTIILGCQFLYLQFQGWKQLVADGIFFAGSSSNPSGSFVYVFTGFHGLHIVGGIVVLMIALIKAFQWRIHKRNMITIKMASIYWHFVDAIWVYLFVFLSMLR